MEAPILFLIDYQQGYGDDAPELHGLAARAATFARMMRERDPATLVLAFRFRNRPDSTYWRLVGHDMCSDRDVALLDPIAEIADIVVDKAGYSALTADVRSLLHERGARRVLIAGVDTDQCVLATVFALFDEDFEPVVIADLCMATSGAECHDAGLVALRRAVTEDRVVSSDAVLDTLRAPQE